MMILLAYDIDTNRKGGPARLQHIARICEKYGQRVQNSVFEIAADPRQLECLKKELSSQIDPASDSIRIYRLGKNYESRITILGKGSVLGQKRLLAV